MPRQPGPPRTQLPDSKIYLYINILQRKHRDHRRPLDEAQGGGGGGGGGGDTPISPSPGPVYPN